MRYIQPTITGTFDAVSTINGHKELPNIESSTGDFTNGPAYPADE